MKFVLFLALSLAAIQAKAAPFYSEYTSVAEEDCFQIPKEEFNSEIDTYEGICPGVGPYVVEISGGDLRYNLKLIVQGQEVRLSEPAYFHDIGSKKVEWRYQIINGKKQYTALIYRLNAELYDDENKKTNLLSILYVVRLNGKNSCVIGEVAKSKNMNKKARAIADNLNLTCW